MVQVKFTWEDARAKFDKLAPQVNERAYHSYIVNERLALVIFNHTYGFFWLEDGEEVDADADLTIWTDVYARDFYKVKSPSTYERRPIVESVKKIYNLVNHTIDSKVILDYMHKDNKVKNQVSISYWDPHNWDRSSYVAPEFNKIEGYLGAKGLEGSKVSQLAAAQGNVIGLLRKELRDAIDAGYIPNDLNATVRKGSGTTAPKYILTVTFNVKREDVLDDLVDLDNPNKFKPPYRELYDRIIRVFNAFNYNKSNSQVDHIDRGYVYTVVLNFLD